MDAAMFMTEKKKKLALPAEKPIEPASPATEEDKQVAQEIVEAKPLTVKEEIALIKHELAQADENFKTINGFLGKMEPLIKLSEQLAARQNQTPTAGEPQAGSFNAGSLLQLIPQLLGSGGGSNPIGEEITKKIVDAGLDSMFSGQRFLKAVQDKMLQNMGVEIANQATQALPK
jgi:hypothetical protein